MSICERAIAVGLGGIALTDHINISYGAERNREVIANVKEDIARARKTFGGRIEISMGLELGEAHHNLPLARELTSDDEIDFVIGSLHQPRNYSDYCEIDFDRADLDINELFRVYYDEMLEIIAADWYDVIGHLNIPLRYMSAGLRAQIDLSPYLGIMRAILKEVARAGKGIEINTSGLWWGAGFTLPSKEVVKMFREEGGEIATTGTDTHRLEQVGLALDGGVKCLISAGFEKFAFYKKTIPHFHKI